jgi:hypothetical protein
MTKFNPENKEALTYGECLDPAMKITDEADAKQYFADSANVSPIARERKTMTAKILKVVLEDVPDDWTVVVEQPEGERYHTEGARGDENKCELVIEL